MSSDDERRARQEQAIAAMLAMQDRQSGPAAPAAGWYPHPGMADTQRYWDGLRWTGHVAPGLPPSRLATAAQPDVTQTTSSLETVGLWMMVLFPVGGFIAGAVLLSRKPGAGMTIMIASVFFSYLYARLLL